MLATQTHNLAREQVIKTGNVALFLMVKYPAAQEIIRAAALIKSIVVDDLLDATATDTVILSQRVLTNRNANATLALELRTFKKRMSV